MEQKSINSNILYLDDEQDLLNIFSINLAKYFKVHTTTKFAEAVKIIQNNDIKVVLTDQRMPEISGIDFIKHIKKDFPDIVCIIISGYADKDVLFSAINEIDVFRFIQKPSHFEEVIHTIEKAIEKYDATIEKKRVDAELRVALKKTKESDRLKMEFLRSISHEIRTPANGVVGYTSLIKENPGKEVPLEYLNIIYKSVLKLVDTVDNMIMASRIQARDIQINNQKIFLNDLLEELHSIFSPEVEEKGGIVFRLVKRKGEEKIPITTDKEKLYNIFLNLLRNALKFTSEGYIEFGVFDEQKMIFYVKDTGIGINDTDKPAIFKYFTQGKQKPLSAQIEGIGLGLSIVKGLVNMMNGKIWFESEKCKGSVFYFSVNSQ